MSGKSVGQIVTLAFKGIAVAMAVAAVVTNVLGVAAVETQALLALGSFCFRFAVHLRLGQKMGRGPRRVKGGLGRHVRV